MNGRSYPIYETPLFCWRTISKMQYTENASLANWPCFKNYIKMQLTNHSSIPLHVYLACYLPSVSQPDGLSEFLSSNVAIDKYNRD